jgi:hypothetical protein
MIMTEASIFRDWKCENGHVFPLPGAPIVVMAGSEILVTCPQCESKNHFEEMVEGIV